MKSIRNSLTGAIAVVAVGVLAACGDGSSTPAPSSTSRPPTAQGKGATPPANRAPVIERVTITPAEPDAYDTLKVNVAVDDADGDRSTVRTVWWVNGRRAGESPSFDLEGLGRGAKVEVEVFAHDGQDESEPMTASVTLGNGPPRIDAIRFEPSGDWVANETMAALPDASDPDGDPLTFEYVWFVNGRPLAESGPTLDGSQLSRGDRVVLEVVASDGQDTSDTRRTEEIEVSNAAPEITSTPGAIGPDGVFRYQVQVSDPDGDRAFMYRMLEAPPGMSVDTLEGKVVWTPTRAHTGRHDIEIEVDDRMGGKTTQRFELDVTFDGAPPASPN